eukprot:6323567-Alexandrium_andersonii.AAC.1
MLRSRFARWAGTAVCAGAHRAGSAFGTAQVLRATTRHRAPARVLAVRAPECAARVQTGHCPLSATDGSAADGPCPSAPLADLRPVAPVHS